MFFCFFPLDVFSAFFYFDNQKTKMLNKAKQQKDMQLLWLVNLWVIILSIFQYFPKCIYIYEFTIFLFSSCFSCDMSIWQKKVTWGKKGVRSHNVLLLLVLLVYMANWYIIWWENQLNVVVVVVKVTQSCPTLWDPTDCSPPGSSVHGILQARILEWVAIPISKDIPYPGIEPRSPALQADSLPFELLGNPDPA